MPYTYTELDLGMLQNVSQNMLQDVSCGTPCKTPFIPHVSPNGVDIARKRTF